MGSGSGGLGIGVFLRGRDYMQKATRAVADDVVERGLVRRPSALRRLWRILTDGESFRAPRDDIGADGDGR